MHTGMPSRIDQPDPTKPDPTAELANRERPSLSIALDLLVNLDKPLQLARSELERYSRA